MSASQFVRNVRSPRGGTIPLAPQAAASDVGETTPSAPDLERVLAEINHELGNYFHKLYYWADTVTAPESQDGMSTEMLGRTLQGFESSSAAHSVTSSRSSSSSRA